VSEIEWREPWYSIEDQPDIQAALEAELQRELGPGHFLAGRAMRAIGRRDDCDDVLYRLSGAKGFAVVHLTWSRSREVDAVWPGARLLPDENAVNVDCIRPDADEFAGAGG
jgi:hypothetical protein